MFAVCAWTQIAVRGVVYNIRVRVVSDIKTLAFGSSLYIRYDTAAHAVNSTYKTLYAHINLDNVYTTLEWLEKGAETSQ